MRPRLVLLAGLLVAASVACASLGSPSGTAGPSGSSILPDPAVGLETLESYQASVVVTFDGVLEGKPTQQREAFTQNVWRTPQAEFTTFEGRDQNGDPLSIVSGTVGEASYAQEGDQPCFVRWGSPPETDFSPASQLWAVGNAQSDGTETILGIPSIHYALEDAAFEFGDGLTAIGDLWLAEDGGYVVKYSLTLQAGEAYLGQGSSGTSQIEYELTQVNARPEIVYPAGCQPVYTGIPVLPDALQLNRQPSVTIYLAATDLAAARAFYEEEMSSLGWELDATHESDPDRLGLLFAHSADGLQAILSMREEPPGLRVIAAVFGLPDAAAAAGAGSSTPEPDAAVSTSAPVRVMTSLQALLGSDSEPSVLASYHLEASHQAPVWTGSSIGQQQDTLEADVQAANIHFKHQVVSAGGSASTEEAYLMGPDEYRVENGTVRPGIGMARLTWAMWPLDPTAVLSAGVSGAALTGTETLDGRTAEVYTLAGSGMALPGGGLGAGMILPVTSATGNVWVDQQTGALLKAVLDYQADVMDADGQSHGTGNGHLEILVTRIGQVEVSLP